ncbi:hypothetical protein HZF08_12825 [Paenibacillus sp. CGMCC 1.16610]|uniref:HAD family hydrolase n=1 Tax=Paenibacillus anseongense TaxID=2682845 RepID=A0ABW9U7Z8_9BACL|nr:MULTISPECIES: HAD family hydrolase [Paenibacillus]MBA2939192.1 hypothetical protein [Paenibacillus sp. CGMCC 1.16610]MVQ35151.1 hypothetical protein [Paenibacillus anseongense]
MPKEPHAPISPTDLLLWEKDRYLSVLAGKIQGIRLLSLDIFDTLLFRTCANPSDVFAEIAEQAHRNGFLKTYVSPEAFKEMRIRAEHKARAKQTARTGFGEVTLELIYEEIPEAIGRRDELARMEVEVEAEFCYVNPHITSLLYACKKERIPVALLSDMYLSSEQLRRILASAGLDLSQVDTLLVSSEEREGKSSGHLFARLKEFYPQIDSQSILHIGDNIAADVEGASKAGIRGLHYPVILEHFESIHHWEFVRHGDVLPEWKSLRKLAAASDFAAGYEEKERVLYQFGTDVIGPFLHTLCEWVLDICVQEGVTCVNPLMREAYLLAPMLEQAAQLRGMELQVKPVYVSRQATFMAGLEHFGEDELAYLLNIQGLKVRELFDVLGVGLDERDFELYLEKPIEACKYITGDNGETIYSLLYNYLQSESGQSKLSASIERHRQHLVGYLTQEFGSPNRLVTIDIGFQGTIQGALEKIVRLAGLQPEMLHLLAVGTNRLDELRLQGMDIRSMLRSGSGGSESGKRIARTPAFLEELMMGGFGSTLRYSEDDSGRISPIQAQLHRSEEEYAGKLACQKGALAFQRYYAYLLQQKDGRLSRASMHPEEWSKPLHRVLAMPKPEEARVLGDLTHQDNFCTEYIALICEAVAEEWYLAGPEAFLNSCNYAPSVMNVNWPQGMATRRFPYYLYHYYLQLADGFGSQAMIFDTLQRVKKDGIVSLMLYGTGAFAEQVLKAAWFHGLHISYWIDPAVEANTAPWGRFSYKTLEQARALSEASGRTAPAFLIATLSELETYPSRILKAFEGSDLTPKLYQLRP